MKLKALLTRLSQEDIQISDDAIRNYISIGLLHPPLKISSKQAIYDEGHFNKIITIRKYRDDGKSIKEIKALLDDEQDLQKDTLIVDQEKLLNRVNELSQQLIQYQMSLATKIEDEPCSRDEFLEDITNELIILGLSKEEIIESLSRLDAVLGINDAKVISESMAHLYKVAIFHWFASRYQKNSTDDIKIKLEFSAYTRELDKIISAAKKVQEVITTNPYTPLLINALINYSVDHEHRVFPMWLLNKLKID